MSSSQLTWDGLGDVQAGRPGLGPETTVLFYRLLLETVKKVLASELGGEAANRLIKEAGETAGQLIYGQFLTGAADVNQLIHGLAAFLKDNNAGILRVLEANEGELHFVFSLLEDLECSGTPVTGHAKCKFDQGLIAGVLSSFFGRRVSAEELECWGLGQSVCRYEVKPENPIVTITSPA